MSKPDVLNIIGYYLKEKHTTPGTETELGTVKRTVWNMLYANDARTVSRSPRGLMKMISIVVQVCSAFGLDVPKKKPDTM